MELCLFHFRIWTLLQPQDHSLESRHLPLFLPLHVTTYRSFSNVLDIILIANLFFPPLLRSKLVVILVIFKSF